MRNNRSDKSISADDMRAALEQGTHSAQRNAPAVWGRIAANQSQPKHRQWALPAIATVTVAIAAVLLAVFIAPSWFTPPDVVMPLASTSPTANPIVITLTTDIQKYSPLMSSAFGIHIFAKDGAGNPIKGKWTTNWGVFIPASITDGGYKLSDPVKEVSDAADAYWSFNTEVDSNTGEPMPQTILVNFVANSGEKQSLELFKDMMAVIVSAGKPVAFVAAVGEPSAAATPKPTVTVNSGMFGAKFADKFATGDPETTDNSYKSKTISVIIKKKQKNNITWYVADIYVRNLKNFRTALAKDEFHKGISEPTLDMANSNSAIVAISGDNYGMRETGLVIRNGIVYQKTSLDDLLVMNNNGSMQTFENKGFNVNDVVRNGAWQAWSFGPMLLDKDGQPMVKFNSMVNPANPRAAIGYYEPGHYCLVLVDGKQPGYSDGITLKALSQLFSDMGCKAAYNLDGGQTAVMAFMGKVISQPFSNGRSVSDIVYISEKTN